MKILVLNGSPKGQYSITLQTVRYLEKMFPKHTFQVVDAGQRIKALERDLTPVLEAVKEAQLVLFAYPVYTFIAPSQLHRLIELLKESGVDLQGKFATQITTSKHFYDVTAHRYIQENCQDMGMKFIKGLSADMDDLLTPEGRKQAVKFFRYVCWCMAHGHCETAPEKQPEKPCVPVTVPDAEKTESADGEQESADGKKETKKSVVIVTDCRPEDENLRGMIEQFKSALPVPGREVNIREYPFRGGCLGCFRCAVSGKCIYTDGFDEFLRNDIQKADAIVYAFTVRDHSMGAAFKQYDDRQFCNGHRTVTMGMPMGYLVSGNYSREENLRTIIEARCEVGGNFLAGVATDETDPYGEIRRLAETLAYALDHRYVQPSNFYGVGGMKIFRDLIYLMQGMMKADHRFYKSHGQYDFPQKKKGTVLKMYAVGALLSSPKVLAKMGNQMNEGMLAPYRKIVDGCGRQSEEKRKG